jgi:small subunit ribosomal protein S8
MSMNDPISDLLTRVRNALQVRHADVTMPRSALKEEICRLLEKEGYIDSFTVAGEGAQASIRIALRYTEEGGSVIHGLRRVSRPSLRVYVGSGEIRPVRSGLGISVISTSQGIMTGKQAREKNVGGEVLCEVW